MAKAYFDCVNDNGGSTAARSSTSKRTSTSTRPQIAASRRSSLKRTVLGFVGNTSIIDCSVNRQYYTDNGFFPIIAGVDQACFTTANFSAVNMGPYYSSLGGAQAALRAGAKGTLVIITGNQPGVDLH